MLATCYTGFLFAQGLARDLWQGPQSTIDLLAQAVVEGRAVLLLASLVPGVTAARGVVPTLALTLVVAMLVHLALRRVRVPADAEPDAAPRARRPRHPPRPVRAAVLGRRHRHRRPCRPIVGGAVGPATAGRGRARRPVLALAGSFAWEYIWVEAGQSVPLS